MDGIRYANIGIAVATVIIVVGVLIFNDSSEAAMQASALVGLFAGLIISNVLYTRATRRGGNRTQ